MGATVATMTSVIKDAWTSSRLAKQFYNANPVLDWFQEVEATMIGTQAQVPIHKWRSGGSTSTNAAGGALNSAGNQQVDQALYTLVYLWHQISIETAALNQTGSSAQSIIGSKILEVQGAIDDISKQASRQLCSNGDGYIAQCTTTTTANEIELLAASSGGLGYDAIRRGWLFPGLPVDIGTTSDTDTIASGVTITAVEESASTPSITVDGSTVSTTSSHYVSIKNPNSTTTASPELNGLRNMLGSSTTTLGGINPATAGNEFWKPALVDSSTTSLSLDLALNLQAAVFQKSGGYQSHVLTSVKQGSAFYSLLQNQVRFAGEMKMGAGGVGGLTGLSWNGVNLNVFPDIVDKEWYHVSKDDIVRIVGSIKKPTWTSELEGSGEGLRWSQGNTNFVEGLCFPLNVGLQRRNSHASAVNLTA